MSERLSELEVYVAQLSLVDAQGKPLTDLIRHHLTWLQQNGVTRVLVLGTNGEFPSFTVAQRIQYLETVLSVNPGLEMMVNVAAASIFDALALQRHATSVEGVGKLLWMPPFYFPDHEINGLPEAIERIIAHQPDHIPLLLYHYPKMSQISISAELLNRFPQIAGLKDSSGDLDRVQNLIDTCPDKQIYLGTDYQLTAARTIGCQGIISGLANVFPQEMAQAANGNHPHLENRLNALKNVFTDFCKHAASKAYLNHLALDPDQQAALLPPFRPLTTDETQTLLQRIMAITQEPVHEIR